MASRVNTKFVVLLAGALLVLFVGVAGLAVVMQLRSAERSVARGDAAMAEQDYKLASKMYSRAVAKDRSNSAWLRKWEDALLRVVPESSAEYQKAYREHYLGILTQLAVLNPTDPDPQLELIREIEKSLGSSLASIQTLASTVEERAEQLDPDDPRTKELRAFHGRAIVEQMLRIEVDQEQVDRARTELEEALEANPDDWRSALALVKHQWAIVDGLRRDFRPDAAAEAMAEFERMLGELTRDFGQHPEVHTFAFGIRSSEMMRTAATPEARREAFSALTEDARDTLRDVEDADPAHFTPDAIVQLTQGTGRFLDGEGREHLHEILQRIVQARPDDAHLLLNYGQSFSNLGEYEEAYEVFQRVVQLPDKPVCFEGLLLPEFRRSAVQAQVDILLARHETEENEQRKAELLAEAKERRDRLRELTDVNTEMDLKLRDAQIALLENDVAQAVILLDEIRRNLREDNPRVLRLLAVALQRQGNLGEAVRQYERIIGSGRHNARDLAAAGDIHLALGDPELAESSYRQALRMNPSFEYAQRRLNAILQVTADADDETLDPVVKALVDAQRLSNQGDNEGAIAVLEEAYAEAPEDMRLIRELVSRDLATADRERARERVEAALERMPDRQDLQELHTQLTIEDPVELAETLIEQRDLTPVERAIQLHYVYSQHGMPEKAEASFREAERLDPSHPAVVETGFLRSLARAGEDDFQAAERYVARATEENTDRIGGLTFKGRLELAKGDARAAEATFTRAVERSSLSPMAWRYLGQAQRLNGKIEASLQSLERAYQGRPDHRGIAEDYARILLANQRGEDALEVVRKLVASPQRTDQLIDFWLNLEAEYGDRAIALENRSRMFQQNPSELANGVAYLRMLLQDEEYDAFADVLDTLERDETITPVQAATFRAMALAERGSVKDARASLREFVESLPEDQRTIDALLALGRFERQYGDDLGVAIAAYEQARPLQDPGRLEADRALGDLLFSAAQTAGRESTRLERQDPISAERLGEESRDYFERAAEAYRNIHETSPDDEGVAKRLAETLINLERFSEAEEVLASIENENDLQLLLLRAIIADRRGEPRQARAFLDRAVELYPTDPITYFRRAELNASEETLFPDVVADLDQVTRLRPGMIEAWSMLFALYSGQGRMDEAFAKLNAAIEANPDNDMLKRSYIQILWDSGRQEQAKLESQKFAEEKWDDRDWIERAAVRSYQLGSYAEATRFYQRLYELDDSPLAAADLLNAWFRAPEDPPLPEVNRLVRRIGEIEEESPERTITKKMLMARAQQWLGKEKEADTLTLDAFEMARGLSSNWIAFWFDDLRLRFKTDDSPGMDEAFAFIEDNRDRLGELPPILEIFIIRNARVNGAPTEECIRRLDALAGEADVDANTKLEYHRLQNQLYYSMGEYEKCAEACRAGLAINERTARDLELNNNLAYTLAKHLKDPQGALPFAERAAELAPMNAAVLDTLGWVYFETGRYRDADRVLERAIVVATGPDELVPAHLHLAQSKQATGDGSEARKHILRAREELKKASELIRGQYAEEVNALFEELNP